MEMMVVLLIVAIIAAASAPMVTKKLSRSAGTNDSPWVFTGLNNTISYLGGGNGQVLIGSANRPNSAANATLYIAGRQNWAHLAFGNEDNTDSMGITADPGNGRVGINRINNNRSTPVNSVMFGINQTLNANGYNGVVAIGDSTINGGSNSIAIGRRAEANSTGAISIGGETTYDRTYTMNVYKGTIRKAMTMANVSWKSAQIRESDKADTWDKMIQVAYNRNPGLRSCTGPWQTGDFHGGYALYKVDATFTEEVSGTTTASDHAIAIGGAANANGDDSIAIGVAAVTTDTAARSIAIGNNISVSNPNQISIGGRFAYDGDKNYSIGDLGIIVDGNNITLGTNSNTITIPGNLIVTGKVRLGSKGNEVGIWGQSSGWNKYFIPDRVEGLEGSGTNDWGRVMGRWADPFSDRRLKDIGEKFTTGIEALKQLEFYHYTFKNDNDKIPQVGVMAQDLQKVFPDAVKKDERGYLHIRFEDMFYAVINAVKELDNKIAEIVQNITDINSTIEKQNKTIEELQKTIDKMQKTMEEQQKVIEKLEKQIKKAD